jgi:thiol-disulfide isomerase/thioredoxin
MIKKKANLVLNFCIGGLMLLCLDVSAQTIAGKTINTSDPKYEEIRALSVGEKVPDIMIENIINFQNSTTNISAHKGKLILIDFWGTTCSSCIAALPKIDDLQKQYKDRMQVFTVTNYDTKEKVIQTLKRYKKTQNLSLPVVLNDVKLKKYFPHEMVSHVVWIDGNGVVKAITGTEYINAENIQTVLDGKEVNWPVKDDVSDFDYEKPFWDYKENVGIKPEFLFYSVLTGHIEGINATSMQIVDSSNNTIIFHNYNYQLNQLCNGALGNGYGGVINPKHLILNVKDSGRYNYENSKRYYSEWEKKNTYCYSVRLPLGLSIHEQNRIIQSDLIKWLAILGICLKKEIKKVKCLVLVSQRGDSSLIKPKHKKYFFDIDSSVKNFQNVALKELIDQLNENTPGIPWVLNETGFSDKMNIGMKLQVNSFQDLNSLRRALQQYGLDLLEKIRMKEMYIITEKGYTEK